MQQGNFESIYQLLNPQQKNAVSHIEGPVLVIAGPGTGKTQILAARIAKILLETDAQPENILCLTFTDAGAMAMQKRLIAFIGTEAYKVNIHTFHSFCNLVIQENKDSFDHLDLSPASELEKHESVKFILDELRINDPLKRIKGLVYQDTSSLLQLFQVMKREHLTKEDLLKRIDSYVTYMYDSPDFRYKRKSGLNNVGDLKEGEILANKKKLDRIQSAVSLFEFYNARLKDIQRYDFDDMILWVLNLFAKSPDVLSRYQEKFLYLLVDEFQDTNTSQNEILDCLTSFWDAPNVFAVGDDDQAIYRFQGADLSNILRFQKRYAGHIYNVVLTENYRSCQAILDGAGQVIHNNADRLIDKIPELSKKLVASNPEYNVLPNKPVIRKYPDSYAETVATAIQIEKLITTGVDPKEIAVIYRKHRQADMITKYLGDKQIPFNLVKRSNILELPVIIKLQTLLEYVSTEIKHPFTGENLLFRILHFDEFQIDPLTIAQLSHFFYRSKMNWREGLKIISETKPDFLQQGNEFEKLMRTAEFLENWIKASQNQTVPILIEQMLKHGGFLRLALASTTKYEDLEALKSFFSFVKEEAERKKTLSLEDLMETLSEMTEYHISIPIEHYFSHENGVNLMTAHGSKGLEFEHVFIIDCNRDDWEKDTDRSNFSLSLIFPKINLETILQDNRRLFYVALTRARKFLQVSYHDKNEKGKDLSPARFVLELEDSGHASLEQGFVTNDDRMQFMTSFIGSVEFPKVPLVDENILNGLLDNYSLSATHLNAYLKCPLSFYFNQIIKVPAAKNENMGFGSVIHSTLEFVVKKRNVTGNYPDSAELLQSFEYNMNRQRAFFTNASYKRFLDYGRYFLPKYFAFWIDDWKKNGDVFPEKRIHNAVANGVPINGILDKIIIEKTQVSVVDYKTGKYSNALHKLKAPLPEKIPETFESKYGGDYWRQIMFYKILLDNDTSQNWNMTHGQIDFVEPEDDFFYKIEIPIANEHLEIVKNQISETYKNIMSHRFEIGCGDERCDWCNFVRQGGGKFN